MILISERLAQRIEEYRERGEMEEAARLAELLRDAYENEGRALTGDGMQRSTRARRKKATQ